MYNRPSGINAYSVTEKAFEEWNSSVISTIRAFANTDAMASYSLLMISEIGHRYDLFDTHGWALLEVILVSGQHMAFLQSSFEVFRNFFQSIGIDLFSSVKYRQTVSLFWKTYTPSDEINNFIECSINDSNQSLNDNGFSLRFWASICFSVPDWPGLRSNLEFLNYICQITFHTRQSSEVLSLLSAQYRSLIFKNGDSTNSSLIQTIRVGMFEKRKDFPSLIWETQTIPLIGRRTKVADGLFYFQCFAYMTESVAEREIRAILGRAIIQQGMLKDIDISIEKPLSEFSIYKVAEALHSYPLDHPTSPVLWQIFFTLYLERQSSDVGLQCFGHRFFDEEQHILSALESRLEEGSSLDRNLGSWRNILSSLKLWIFEPRLVMSNSDQISFSPDYHPELISSCQSGSLFINGSKDWWKTIVPLIHHESVESKKETLKREIIPSPIPVKLSQIELPLPYPLLVINDPVLSHFEFDQDILENVLNSINKDFELLKQQALHHSSLIQQHNSLDKEYIDELPKLFGVSKSSCLITKRCSNACAGIIFQFDQEKSGQNTHSTALLSVNRKKVEGLISLDLVDSRTTTSGLRIMLYLEWLISNKGKSAYISKEAIRLFYNVLNLMDMKLQAYPPAENIITLAVTMLGEEFLQMIGLMCRNGVYYWKF